MVNIFSLIISIEHKKKKNWKKGMFVVILEHVNSGLRIETKTRSDE